MINMEGLLTATFGELVSRCISLLISRYTMPSGPSREECLQRLNRTLLRLAVVVEEAEARCITNQAMLQQLSVMRREMYRGCYVLDTCRYLAHGEGKKARDQQPSSSLAPSPSDPGKRVPFSAPTAKEMADELEQMLGSIETLIADMTEFVIFLKNYPPICRQPYSMHLVLETCMFGRHAEMEQIICFLLQKDQHPGTEDHLDVLPIVGPAKVGKSTLVEHVCCDMRVRDHFSRIYFLGADKFTEEKLSTLTDGGILKHQTRALKEKKILFVVELDEDVGVLYTWRRLFSASQGYIPAGSKIIITSRSDKIIEFGTTQALRLNFLPRDASWYFFKVLAFGSMVPEDQPKLASIAMMIFEKYFDSHALKGFSGLFTTCRIGARLLGANVSVQHWQQILSCARRHRQINPVEISISTSDTRMAKKHIYLQRVAKQTEECVVDSHVRIRLAHEEIPKITTDDIILGTNTPPGRFEAVAWRSHLPPYYTYMTTCEIRKSKLLIAGNKHAKKRKELC